MILRNRIETYKGIFEVEYRDVDGFEDLELADVRQAYGICFYRGRVVICRTKSGKFILPGGTLEEGESIEEALVREVKEESNMKVLRAVPIGYQKCWNETEAPFYQTRWTCLVEPYGDFESDPAGHIVAVELMEVGEAEEALGWDEVGSRLFERAGEVL